MPYQCSSLIVLMCWLALLSSRWICDETRLLMVHFLVLVRLVCRCGWGPPSRAGTKASANLGCGTPCCTKPCQPESSPEPADALVTLIWRLQDVQKLQAPSQPDRRERMLRVVDSTPYRTDRQTGWQFWLEGIRTSAAVALAGCDSQEGLLL